jgi:hypothetical protein
MLAELLRFQSSVNVERARNFPQYRSLPLLAQLPFGHYLGLCKWLRELVLA